MNEYSLEAVLWSDHTAVNRSPLRKNPEELLIPVLSIGIVIDETDNVIVLASDIERYEDRDDLSYTIIIKSAIVNRKSYGTIKVKKPRREG